MKSRCISNRLIRRSLTMERRTQEIHSSKNKHIKIGIIPGHFATNLSHVNYYVDMTSIKKRYKMAKDTAKVFAAQYMSQPIDTIICLEETQMLGAFLADELSSSSSSSVNSGTDINVLTPEMDSSNQMIFRDNTQSMIWNKRVLILISSVSTGWTIDRCVECLKYYNGILVGVGALFSAVTEASGVPLHAIFEKGDLPEYTTHIPSQCPMCKNRQKVDAIINAYGYSKI